LAAVVVAVDPVRVPETEEVPETVETPVRDPEAEVDLELELELEFELEEVPALVPEVEVVVEDGRADPVDEMVMLTVVALKTESMKK